MQYAISPTLPSWKKSSSFRDNMSRSLAFMPLFSSRTGRTNDTLSIWSRSYSIAPTDIVIVVPAVEGLLGSQATVLDRVLNCVDMPASDAFLSRLCLCTHSGCWKSGLYRCFVPSDLYWRVLFGGGSLSERRMYHGPGSGSWPNKPGGLCTRIYSLSAGSQLDKREPDPA